MKTILALAGAATAGIMAFSAANAQDCVNGYRTIGNDVIVLCDTPAGFGEAGQDIGPEGLADEPIFTGSIAGGPDALAVDYREGMAAPEIAEEPMVTGSIATPAPGGLPQDYREGPPIAEPTTMALEAEGPWACQPGQYWVVGGEGRDTPILC